MTLFELGSGTVNIEIHHKHSIWSGKQALLVFFSVNSE